MLMLKCKLFVVDQASRLVGLFTVNVDLARLLDNGTVQCQYPN